MHPLHFPLEVMYPNIGLLVISVFIKQYYYNSIISITFHIYGLCTYYYYVLIMFYIYLCGNDKLTFSASNKVVYSCSKL